MNSTEIKSILRSPYNRENWKNLYRNIFQNKVTFHEEPYPYNVNENFVESLFQIGYATLDDEYIVALFEVNIKSDVNLLSKKIGLRKIISKYISDDKFNGVLTIFENGSPDYRFTFASKTTKITEEGIEVVETESKRFTYILGENEPCLTPTQRFESLLKKNGKVSLEDIKDAFSVEKLNKEFFNGYKEHYEALCKFFYSSLQKKKVFNDNEKSIRDFVKKFLGRIVFLYFVQKKGWLGVKKGANWGTGDPMFISNLYKSYKNKNEFYNKVISKIFFEYLSIERNDDIVNLFEDKIYRIPYLNGGLFEKEDIDKFEINFEQSFLDSLFSFFDRFNFTIYEDDPNEHTVAVDPEMLGHIFENLLEDNKDKGAFYTPKEIVHYMCQESLIEYITTWFENIGYEIIGYSSFDNQEQVGLFSENEGRKGQLVLENMNNHDSKIIDRTLIENLLKKKLTDQDKNLILEHSKEFHSALDKVKICDPAIGSGAFPMGLLQEIFLTKQTLWNFEHESMDNFPASDIKLNIIQNSIYGVDIEKGAVDIARLRFWLSLIVDEDEPKSLPNLDYKIVVGNSLVSLFQNEVIEIDWDIEFKNTESVTKIILDQQNKIYQLEHAQHLFFQSFTNKEALNNKIKNLKIEILKNQLTLTKISFVENNPILGGFLPTEKEITINNNNKYFTNKISLLLQKLDEIQINEIQNLDYFDWKINFPEVLNSKISKNPGFDIVIGNPPYIQLQKMQDSKKYENQNFITYSKSSDIYCLFYEKGINLLKKGGNLAYITSNSWQRTKYGQSLRKMFVDKANPNLLINFENTQVFETAIVESNILVIRKEKWNHNMKGVTIDDSLTNFSNLSNFVNQFAVKINELDENGWNIGSDDTRKLKAKIETDSTILKNLNISMDYGIKTGFNEAFIINEEKRNELIRLDKNSKKIIHPIVRGRDVKKYKISFSNLYIISTFPSLKLNIDDFPQIKNHLTSFSVERLEQSGKVGSRKKTGNKWFETQDQISYYKNFLKEKIFWIELSDKSGFCIDSDNFYPLAGTWVMTGENLKFLLSILNSNLGEWYFTQISTSSGMGTNMWKKYKVELMPIKNTTTKIIEKITKLVDNVMIKKSKSIETLKDEFEINNFIYKLYNLTYNEVLIIDPKFSLTNKEYEDLKLL